MRDKNNETLVGQFFDVMENIRSRELDEEGDVVFVCADYQSACV